MFILFYKVRSSSTYPTSSSLILPHIQNDESRESMPAARAVIIVPANRAHIYCSSILKKCEVDQMRQGFQLLGIRQPTPGVAQSIFTLYREALLSYKRTVPYSEQET